MPLRIVSFGLGPIGQAAARLALTKNSVRIVGAIDVDPEKVGRDLGELLGQDAIGVAISDDAKGTIEMQRPDAVLHCTSSFIPVVKDQLCLAAERGVNVVSSSEELLVPDLQHPQLAAEIDEAAKRGRATVLGTGVNPGFVMDTLAVIATGVCFDVSKVECRRVVDAGTRRLPLQKKVGAGMTADAFQEAVATGRFGHIGLRESIALVAMGCGWELDSITQTVEPMIAEEDLQTEFLTVKKGDVAGIKNKGQGKQGETLRVDLDLRMYVGAKSPVDEILIHGNPPMHLCAVGGTPGDHATAAILVNSLPRAVAAEAGLKTMLDLAVPRVTI